MGRLACEVEANIDARELLEWSTFFRMEAEAQKKARVEAEQSSRSRRR